MYLVILWEIISVVSRAFLSLLNNMSTWYQKTRRYLFVGDYRTHHIRSA